MKLGIVGLPNVGKEVAEFIMKNGMCLEEFAAHYK